ncbi:hypothetical protein ACFP63_16585 [Oerskovia jenensis]|uniref:Uncharacterized protein n=1 Tax=Oerskovia jenensis TaxID=162169 RepID=A0ABS2LEH6_9CELL|nr:hypothetical protein [Oerskovia jenensis]MBM7478747.1 hypothetical protein [Oerskovia jenensis]
MSARKDGSLLVRVPVDRHGELLGRLGASTAEMGAGRTMGPGWIEVAATAITYASDLALWVDIARERA